MKLQDRFPYDSTLLRLQSIYHPNGDDSIFINSPCILTDNEDKIITKNEIYDLLDFQTPVLHHTQLKLLDVLKKGNVFYLIGLNVHTGYFL